ncbi:hypothetical protein FPOAC2_10912 [Fusarium poae]
MRKLVSEIVIYTPTMKSFFCFRIVSYLVYLSLFFCYIMADHQIPAPKRFITGHNYDGKAIFDTQLSDEIPTNILTKYNFRLGYVTRGFPVDLTGDSDIKTY